MRKFNSDLAASKLGAALTLSLLSFWSAASFCQLAGAATTAKAPAGKAAPAHKVESDVAVVLKSNTIKFRIAKTHLMHAGIQKPDGEGEPSVHVYMSMIDHAYPYVISLGNFVVVKAKDGEVKVVDEFGEQIPLPYKKPERVGFHKGDLLALKAFDLASDGKFKDALKAIEEALKEAPNSYRVHNNRGVLLTMMNHRADAEKEYAEAIRLNPSCAAAYTNRGWLAVSVNKPDLAIESANMALKFEPDLNSARMCIIKAKLESGDSEEAKAMMEKTGLAKKNDTASLRLQAETLIASKSYKDAVIVLRKLIMLAPNDANAVLQLAYVCDKEGDLDEAILRARQAVVMVPENPSVREILGRYLEKNRDDTAAALQYEAAIDMLNSMGSKDRMKKAIAIEGPLLRSIMRLNDFKRAERWSSYFAKQFPTSASAHYNRAWLLSQGPEDYHIKESLLEYELALKLDPGLKQTHYNLALLSIKTGDRQRAEAELKAFLELAPDDPDHENAKSMLAKLQAGEKIEPKQ